MRHWLIIHLGMGLVLAALVACSRSESAAAKRVAEEAKTPEAAFALQYEFLRTRDADALWELYAGRVRREMDGLTEDLRRMPNEAFRRQFGIEKKQIEGLDARGVFTLMVTSPKMMGQSFELPTIDETEELDEGLVELRFQVEGAMCRQRFREEDGAWRVDAMKACRRSRPGTPPAASPPASPPPGGEPAP